MVGRNKMYLKRKEVRILALRIMYDLATRVPQVLLHRVEECDPSARVKLAELMQDPDSEGKQRETVTPVQEEPVTESEAAACVTSEDTNKNLNDQGSHTEPIKVTIKQEIIDDNNDDWYCIDTNVAIKLEVKEEMTFEEHNIYVDDNVINEDDLRGSDQSSGDSLREHSDLAVRCITPVELVEFRENWSTSDDTQDALPSFEITKIKREEGNDTMMARPKDSSFMSLTPENSPVESHKNYMVKFPKSVVRSLIREKRSKKKECRMCKKKFDDELRLAEHMSVHSGHFTCMVCGEVFQCHGALKGHIRVHVGERPYHCKLCLISKSRCNT